MNHPVLLVTQRQRRIRAAVAAVMTDPFLAPLAEQAQGYLSKAGPLLALSGIRMPKSVDEVDSADVDRGLLHLTHCLISAGYVDLLRELLAAAAPTPESTP